MSTLTTRQRFSLGNGGRFLLVAAVHVTLIYAVATSLGIVKVPQLIKPMEAVLVDLPNKAQNFKPPVAKPDLQQPKIDIPLDTPIPQIEPEVPVEVAPSDAMSASSADSAPSADLKVTNRVEPAYPPVSRRASEEGTGVFRVLVDAKGLPSQVQVQRSTGYPRLDESAMAAIKRWKFAPAMTGSGPVQSWTSVQVTFRLDR